MLEISLSVKVQLIKLISISSSPPALTTWDPSIEERTGVSLATLEDLAERMKNCRYGVLFFGMGLTMTRGRHFNSGALLALATDLNEYTHFVAKPVRGHGNVTGADNVVAWRTGYPFGVNLARGFPRFRRIGRHTFQLSGRIGDCGISRY